MRLFTKKVQPTETPLRRQLKQRKRIAVHGNLINKATEELGDWLDEALASNKEAHSVVLRALIDAEYEEKRDNIQQQIVELERLVKKYENYA